MTAVTTTVPSLATMKRTPPDRGVFSLCLKDEGIREEAHRADSSPTCAIPLTYAYPMAESRGGRVRSESSRLSILGATRKILAEQGYDGLTIEGVAAEARVGKQTIYRWWPSKSALVAECIADAGSADALEMPVPDSGDIEADLESWLTLISQYSAEPHAGALLRGLVSAAAESPLVAERLYSQVTRAAEEALTLRLSGGQEHLSEASRVAAIALFGAFIYSILVNRQWNAATVRELAGLVARGLEKKSY